MNSNSSWIVINIDTKAKNEIVTQQSTSCFKVLDFKKLMNVQLDTVRIDQFVLYSRDGDILKDNKPLSDYKFSSQVLYYRVEDKLIKITVDVFQENIDKIVLYLGQNVSVYYIKQLLVEKAKLKSNENILFYGNRILRDDQVIADEVLNNMKESWMSYKPPSSHHMPDLSNMNTYSSTPRSISLKYVKKKGHSNSLSFGIDFSFNYLKSLTKINWNTTAPDIREVNDGMCLICYCTNKKCPIYKEMFIQNLGYGRFTIMTEIKLCRCVCCKSGSVDVKNLGFVNSEWIFKGLLKSNLTATSGEGKTFDEKMHTFKETDLNSIFVSLDIAVSKYTPVEVKGDVVYSTMINETEEEENADCDEFDSNVDEFSLMSSRKKNNNFGQFRKDIVRNYK